MSEKQTESLFWLALMALVVSIWWAPAIPSQDGPSHLYNLMLLEGLWHDDPHWTAHHTLSPILTTNLGFLAFAWPLSQILPNWAVERAIVSLHLFLIATFAVSWLRVTDRPVLPAAWIVFAFAFPWPVFMGFYGFQLACDLALLGICAAWHWRNRPIVANGPVFWLMGFSLVILHAGGAALFAALLALVELTRRDISGVKRIGRATYLTAPVWAALILAMTQSASLGTPPGALSWQPLGLIAFFALTLGSVTFTSQGLMFIAIIGGFLYLCVPSRDPTPDISLDHAGRFCLASAFSLLALHILLPDSGFGGGMMTGRFIGWVPLLLLPVLKTQAAPSEMIPRDRIPLLVGAAGVASLVFAVVPLAIQMGEIRDAATRFPSDGTVAGIFFDLEPSTTAMTEPLLHVDSYFAMPRGRLVTNYETSASFFPVRRSELGTRVFAGLERAVGIRGDWRSTGIDTLLTIDAKEGDRVELARAYDSIWKGSNGRVELWRRRSFDS